MKLAIIVGIVAIILLLLIIRPVTLYAEIKDNTVIEPIINCELSSRKFSTINIQNANKSRIDGISFLNYIFVTSLGKYNLSQCFSKHTSDIKPDIRNFTIIPGKSQLIEYNITNNQDKKLFYECIITTDCTVERKFFTNYLDPGKSEKVYFNITCEEGVHNATIKTTFVDELRNMHITYTNILISALSHS